MENAAGPRPFGRLGRLAQQASETVQERCELCSEPIAREHRHLLNMESRQAICVCRACSILFDRDAASNGHYRLLPDRRLALLDFDLDDALWDGLHIPVGLAYLLWSTAEDRPVAYYPSPMGQTESLLSRDAWSALLRVNPILGSLQPDVEAVLVNRARGARQYFLVPLDECFSLTGLTRLAWRGLSGGPEFWKQIDRFFAALARRAKPARSADPIRTPAVSHEPAEPKGGALWQ
jgi:hypothetical protein